MSQDAARGEPAHGDDEVVERFRPTSGPLLGSFGVLMAAGVVVVAVVGRDDGVPATVGWGALLVGILVWAAMLRPRVWVTRSHLVLRNMLDTVSIPLAAIEQIVVRQVLAVRAGEKRYVCPAVGKSLRQTVRSGRPPARATQPVPTSYPDFVEERLHHFAEEARAKAGIALMSEEQLALAAGVRRERAWPEIVLLVLAAGGAVLSLLV